jgi:filamentous hemagglutinin family protein
MTPIPVRARLRLFRNALLGCSALVAPLAVSAQTVAPDARPQLDRVVAGGITIRQDAAQTQVTQSEQRGIIDWRRFDVGRDHHVQFQQPSSRSITLNRVTTPDPSVIAGRVTANGQIAIVNQSGVVFSQGAQVEAAGVIASTADISNQNFMAGRMVFDRPGRPDARIENAGSITVREAGLAALVAPQVANRGTITARLGRVALAGGETHVVDLHGDGLLSIEVTGAVRQAPGGGTALVTNTGVIEAQGGTVQLSAAAADGIVQDLVRAGGRVSANTDAATGRTGQVLIAGTGGAIRIEGEVSAVGTAAGTRGGTIEAVAERVLVDRTARVNASGQAGGGEVAIGTTRRGATAPRLARRTGVAAGAEIRADATAQGSGGTVTVNSQDLTVHAGVVSARGGPEGGDGGFVEISGQRGLQITGSVDVGAPAGKPGTVLIDPMDLYIIGDGDPPPAGADPVHDDFLADLILRSDEGPNIAYLFDFQITNLIGDVRLEAQQDIFVQTSLIGSDAGSLTLFAGRHIEVSGSISGWQGITLRAGFDFGSGAAEGDLSLLSSSSLSDFIGITLSASRDIILDGSIDLFGGTLGAQAGRDILVNTPLFGGSAAGALTLLADRHIEVNNIISEWPGVVLRAQTGDIRIQNGGAVFDDASIALRAGNAITLGGPVVTQGTLDMEAGPLGISQTALIEAAILRLRTTGNAVLDFPLVLVEDENRVGRLAESAVTGNLFLRTGQFANQTELELAEAITVGGTLTLEPWGGVLQLPGSAVQASALDIFGFGDVTLRGDNRIAQISRLISTGTIDLRNVQNLLVAGPVDSADVPTVIMDVEGDLTIADSISSIGEVRLRASGNLSLTSTGSITAGSRAPFVTLQAAVDFGSGEVDPNAAGGMSLAGTVSAVEGSVLLGAGRGGIVQTGGGITTDQLAVYSGGDALLTSPANAVDTLSELLATGNFALDNGSTDLRVITGEEGDPGTAATIGLRSAGVITLAEGSTLSAPGETGRISINAGSLVVQGGASAAAALVEIAPFAATPVLLPVISPTGIDFELTADDLAAFTAQTLRIGGTTFSGTLATTAAGIQIVNPLLFTGTLDLRSLSTIAQLSGADLGVGTLAGAAGGAVTLANAGNAVGSLGDFAAGGPFLLQVTGSLLTLPVGRTVSAGGTLSIVVLGGSLLVDGTVTGATTLLSAADGLTVRGFSAVAQSGDLELSGDSVTLSGLAAAAGDIRVLAAGSASLAGRAQTANVLRVSAPLVTFGGLDAAGAAVILTLGETGTATGALDARALTVLGGRGAVLTGTIAGIGGPFAAALGRRGTADGVLLGQPLPQLELFTFNGCPIGAAACLGVVPLISNPGAVTGNLDPLALLAALDQLRPPSPEFDLRPARDPGEEEELAPPDIRGGDF